MDNAIVPDSSLVTEWTKAIVNVDLERAQRLYSQHSYLLWHPLDNKETRVDTDYAHLTAQLERFQMLGPTLGDNLAAIPYMLLDHLEKTDKQGASLAQQKRSRLLQYLIKNAREDDLNNRTWGTCHNTTLHLAAFLGQVRTMDQLIERGASIDKRNDMGHLPNDVAQKRPTNSRFRQLRAMAESTPDDPNKNKRQSTQQRRQQDIALLSKRSAVKNNPLFKKFEQQQQQQSDPVSTKKTTLPSPLARNAFLKSTGSGNSSSSSSSNDSSNSGNSKLLAIPRGVIGDDDNTETNSEDYPRRTSKIISSLKNKSYVSSSVFRQNQPDQSTSSLNVSASAVTRSSPLKQQSIMEEEENDDDEIKNDQGEEQAAPSPECNDDLVTPELKVTPSLLVEQVAPEPPVEENVHGTKQLVQDMENKQQDVPPILPKEDNEDRVIKQDVEKIRQQSMEQDVPPLSHNEHNEDQAIKPAIETSSQEQINKEDGKAAVAEPTSVIEEGHQEEITTIQQSGVDISNKPIQPVIERHQEEITTIQQSGAEISNKSIQPVIERYQKEIATTQQSGVDTSNKPIQPVIERHQEEITTIQQSGVDISSKSIQPVIERYQKEIAITQQSDVDISSKSIQPVIERYQEEITTIQQSGAEISNKSIQPVIERYQKEIATTQQSGVDTSNKPIQPVIERHQEEITTIQQSDVDISSKSIQPVIEEHQEEITITHQPAVDTTNTSIQHIEHRQEKDDEAVTRDPIAALDDLEPPSKPFAEGDNSRRWSGSQRSHWSVGVSSWDAVLNKDNENHRYSNQSEADSEQWFDSYEDWAASPTEQRGSRSRQQQQQMQLEEPSLSSSPLRHSMTLDTISSMNDYEKEKNIHIMEDDQDDDDDEDFSVKSSNPSASFSPNQRMSGGADSVDTWPATASPFTARSINDDSGDDDGFWKSQQHSPDSEQLANQSASRELKHPSSEQQKITEQDDLSSNKATSSDNQQQRLIVSNEFHDEQEEDQHFGSISVASTTYASHRLPQHRPAQDAFEEFITSKQDEELQLKEPKQHDYQSRLESDQELKEPVQQEYQPRLESEQERMMMIREKQQQQQPVSTDHQGPEHEQHEEVSSPLQLDLLPPVENDPGQSTSAFGKLYVRLSSADGVLLPIPPKLTTYVRCVVSDGDYEYMSRYEVLNDRVVFDYECIMDARPDMIITVSLHVRPDPHVRPRTGLSKWLTSVRKQRETLPAYVHPEDGAIGQTRFALGHMIQACNQKTYGASFDCFNSWFARSSREQHMLKVVGNLNVEMLYLPLSDPSLAIPKSMRECDLALRIRQWHNTCWHSGFLSMRSPGSQLWDRHYCRLIGSQLIGYESKAASASYMPQVQYDIANAVRLVASSDQVIVTLEDIPDTRVFQENTIIEETGRGFFRIVFADAYIDCVCDAAGESEAWVKILKSMIGRVPLKIAV